MAQWIGDVLLLAALIAAIWYAWETRTMRLQMIRPKLVFLLRAHRAKTPDSDFGGPVDLLVRNVGEGAAINVSVERVKDEKGFELRTEPEHIPLVEKGQEVELALRPVHGGYKPDMTLILDDSSMSIRLTARHVDVEGREFRTSTVVGGGAKPPFIKDEKA